MAHKNTTAMLAKIHLGKKQLKMDNDTYREILKNVIGTTSCKGQSFANLEKVITYMKQHGAILTSRKGKPNNLNLDNPRGKLLRKIEALLTDAKRPWAYVTNKSDKKASLLERVTKKQKLEFCSDGDLTKIIQVLSIDKRRREKKVTA